MEDDDFANVHGQVDRIWSQMLCLMFMAKATKNNASICHNCSNYFSGIFPCHPSYVELIRYLVGEHMERRDDGKHCKTDCVFKFIL